MIGTRPYDFIVDEYGKPVVVTAFEPLDILQAVVMLLRQLREGRCEVENQYTRVVRRDGNPRALAALEETMELRDTFEWRGLGWIEQSALKLRPSSPTGTPRRASSFRATASRTRRPASAARS